MSSFRFIRGTRGKSRVKCRGRVRAVAHSDIAVYKYIFVIHPERRTSALILSGVSDRFEVASIRDEHDKCVVDDGEVVGSMTKIRCRICELLGEDQGLNHGLSHPCHLTNLNHLRPGTTGSNYSQLPNMNYLNHGLLNGLYLPQLKDMMLAAYLLRGKDQDIRRRETRDF